MRKENSTASINDKRLLSQCPMQIAMTKIDGKWKIIILSYISQNENRFSLLKKRIPSITDKMLSQQIRELENDGLLTRKIYPEIPPKVEYSLTDDARSLIPAIEIIYKWGQDQKNKEKP
ncbi:MAG: helix-turn-helix domain-containing protein [Puia sp.]|nr:helix-turn-helix domain-containing protein [Puia sp.]